MQRAICFTNGKAHVPILRSACERLGIEFDTLGGCADRFVAHPERELADCDLVFATGRSAIEALCCGAAVIVCDARGLGGLVNSKNCEKFRKLNFALRALTQPLSIETIIADLKKYDVEDAASLAERTRVDASLELLLDRLLEIYRAIITSWSQAQVETNAPASRRAMVDFLHNALPRKGSDARWPWLLERDDLIRVRDHLDRDCAMARQNTQNAERNILELQRALSEERGRRLAAEVELEAIRAGRSWRITATLQHFKRILRPEKQD